MLPPARRKSEKQRYGEGKCYRPQEEKVKNSGSGTVDGRQTANGKRAGMKKAR